MRACGLPSANTSRVAVDFSAQPSKLSSNVRSASSEGAVRAASRADMDGRIRRAARLRPRRWPGIAAGSCPDRLAQSRPVAWRPDVIRIGQPVDRFIRQRAVDPGLEIKGQQLLDGGARSGVMAGMSGLANLGWIGPREMPGWAFPWLFSRKKSETTTLGSILTSPVPEIRS